MKNIAVVIGTNHHNTLGLIRSLGMADIEVIVLVCTDNLKKSYISKSKYIKHLFSYTNDLQCLEILNQLSFDIRPCIFTCTDSASLLVDNNRYILETKYIISKIKNSKNQSISNLMDKFMMTNYATEVGFATPKSWNINQETVEDFKLNILPSISFKTIVKPIVSASAKKEDITICKNADDLENFIDLNLTISNAFLIQEFINKDYELTIIGVATFSDMVILPGAIHKIDEYPLEKGSGTFSHFQKFIDKRIYKLVCNYVKTIGYYGLFSIDMMVSKDQIFFIEINLRNDANSFASTYGGVNLPYLFTLDCQGVDITKKNLKIRSDFYIMSEFQDFKYSLNVKKSLLYFLKNLIKANCLFIWQKSDIKPFIYKFIYAI